MADRAIYLVDTVTKAMEESMQESGLTIVDDTGLSDLLARGYEVTSTLPDRKVSVGNRKVKATMMVLRLAADNRGVSVSAPERNQDRGGGLMTVTDEWGRGRQVSVSQHLTETMDRMGRALAQLGDTGHLGGGRTQSFPGVTIISGEMVAKAFDVGLGAGMRGDAAESCPFPPLSEAQQQWLKGYRRGVDQARHVAPADPVALQEARAAGKSIAAQYGEDDEVTCPYPKGSALREAWMTGFREGGGRVQ
jgi:ribosome modulation factor